MPSVKVAPPAKFSSALVTGAPLVGGKLYTYQAGTSTPYATYTDYTGGVANANPVILDARGEADVWLEEGVAYKFVLKDSSDVTVWTVDGINYNGASGLTYLAADGTVTAPSFSFSNSTGMGFYRISNNVLGVATAGALAVTFDASQNVGIGVTPTAKLDVNGASKFRGALTVTTGGLTITAGGLTISAGGASITGNTTVAGGTFASRGFADNATSAQWSITSAGYLKNDGAAQPAFAAYRGTSQQNSGTALIFNTEQFDNGSNYNNSTGVFTAPVAGVYSFSASVQLINATGALVNGQLMIQCSSAGNVANSSFEYANGYTFSVSTSVVVKLAQGETVQAVLNTSLTSTFVMDTQSWCRFSGALLYGL
jgi:hypothetical protein